MTTTTHTHTGPAGPIPPAGLTGPDHYGRALLKWLLAGGAPSALSVWQLEISDAAAAATVTGPALAYAPGLYEGISRVRHAIAGTLRAKRAIDGEPRPTVPAVESPRVIGGGYRVPVAPGPVPTRPPAGVGVAIDF